jgi:hypothetical protein
LGYYALQGKNTTDQLDAVLTESCISCDLLKRVHLHQPNVFLGADYYFMNILLEWQVIEECRHF